MTSPRPLPATDRRALLEYVRRQRVADAELLRVIKRAQKDAGRALRKLEGKSGIDAAVKRSQLTGLTKVLQTIVSAMMLGAKGVTLSHLMEMGEAAAVAQARHLKEAFPFLADEAIDLDTRNGLRHVLSRLESSKRELSARVYTARALQYEKVDKLVNGALARGASARELAKEVRQYIIPSTPGGAPYAAMRLARTELNNAFHASQVQMAEENEFVTGVRWNLSSSHPKPDECDKYAGKTYKTDKVPLRHPQCLCFLTPEVISEEEFMQSMSRRSRRVA